MTFILLSGHENVQICHKGLRGPSLLNLPYLHYSAYQQKVYTFQKSPHINILKYFQEHSIHVGSYGSLLSNDTKNITILYAWVSRSHICEIDQNPGLTGIGICSVCYQQIESREKASKLSFWWSDDTLWKICFVVCIFWHMPSTFYASSSY